MQVNDRATAFRTITEFIADSDGGEYNVCDMLLSPLYLNRIQQIVHATPIGFFKRIRKYFFRAKKNLYGVINRNVLPDKKIDIVLWPAEYSHLNQMSGVCNRLSEAGFRCIWVTNKQKIAKQLRKDEYEFVYVQDFFMLDFRFKHKLLTTISKKTVYDELRKTVKNHLQAVVNYIRLNEKIIERFEPKALLVGNDLTIEGRVATSVFAKKGIFTACIQHGDMSDPLHAKHVVDKFFLYGKKGWEQVKKYEEVMSMFMIAGPPYLEMNNNALIDTQSKHKYTLVALSGPGNNTSYRHHQMIVDAIFKLGCELSECEIVIKLHPKDNLMNYSKAQQKYNGSKIKIISHDPDISIFNWLKGCEILITGASTTAVEAMHLGIPVITLDFIDEYKGFSFIDEGATLHVKNYTGLYTAYQSLLGDTIERERLIETGKKFAADYFFEGPQLPSHSIAEFLSQAIVK